MSSLVEVSFLPDPARITSIACEADDTRSFVLEPAGEASPAWLRAAPGQFVFLSLLGVGEAAFTISSWQAAVQPARDVVLTVRRVGRLTSALFALRPGDPVGVRGPFGRGFPDWPAHAGATFVAGGCGLAPLRAAIEARIATRAAAAALIVVYGAREPGARIFRADLERWRAQPGVTVHDCVERPDPDWPGTVGDVCEALEQALTPRPTPFAAVCGPPAMLSAVALRLARAGVPPARISLAIERQMKCGLGLCGRCYVGHRLACVDGPVFPLDELVALDPAFAGVAPLAVALRR